MSFFLLGKGSDGELVLLSSGQYASRKEAMAELSKLTKDPGFAHWDAEVMVFSLNDGADVLLVRPEAAAEPVAEKEPEAEPPAEEPITADESEPAEEADDATEPHDAESAELDAALVELGEPQTVTEVDPAIAAVIEDLASEEDASVVEAPEPVIVQTESASSADEVPELESAVSESVSEDESLKAALARTAAHMEASGITPPESVGPEEAAPEPEAANVEPEPEAAATESSESAEAAWPWAVHAPAEEGGFNLDALEEPGIDEGSLVRAPGDDETMAAARPVILGDYDTASSDVEAGPGFEAEADSAAEAATGAPAAPEQPLEAVAVAEVPADDTASAPVAESDFILDLEQIVAEPLSEKPAGYQVNEHAGPTMTCRDCVYVETCPNKDQRDPASCGSFQWK